MDEIPMVCETTAAGLGVRGVVTPWLCAAATTSIPDNTDVIFGNDSFGIA
jgi:hypothetical protein